MAVEIKVPSFGESISEVVLSQWLKKDGDYVEKDQEIAEVETDKANNSLTAPEAGILKTTAREGDTLAIGAIAGSIEPGAKSPTAPKAAAAAVQPATPSPEEKAADKPATESRKATPVARKVAEDLGVDLAKVEGHGTAGKITREDVVAHAESGRATPAPAPAAKQAAPPPLPIVAGSRATSRERMTTLRKKIAARLVEAQHNAAMLTTFNEVDMTAVMETRAKYKESFQKKHGVGLGFMSFFVKACIEALRTFPRVNAYIEGDEVVYHHYHDVGVAVGTERGLVVPVIRNAEALTFAGIEKTIREFGEKGKVGKLTVEELTGGTFTISNGGVYGSMMSTPILNPPQSGILGMHNIIRRPVAIGEQVVIRPMMYLALSYDHRIVDGKEAVGFLVRVKECIESPERLLLEV